jgi:Arylsulfotransferase (ASST)
MGAGFTRQRFLKALGAGAAYLALVGAGGCAPRVWPLPNVSPKPQKSAWAFRSRPDLGPAAAEVTKRAHDTAPGYVFLAIKEGTGDYGPMILDDNGQIVWFGKYPRARDFKMQYYRGRPVLTWWEGVVVEGHGEGEYVIFDDSYREVRRVRAGNGYTGDLHELLITPENTALLVAYAPRRTDLSSVGGPEDGPVWEGIVQEVDIETGEVHFEWRSLGHVGIEESYARFPPDNPGFRYDYFHINSIDVDHDNNLLISARNTWAVCKIDRKTGDVLWRLGGKKSDFEMGQRTRTAFQHDARRQKDGTITIFDNGAHPKVHDQSRAIVLGIDEEEMQATLVREYTSLEKILATSQGNAHFLPDGNVFVGWGSAPFVSEFSREGELLFEARFPPNCESYKAFRFPWNGYPTDAPAVAVERRPEGKVAIYASWNGATEVESWEVVSGPSPGLLAPLGSVPREGFETAMLAQTYGPYVAVRAKDRSGEILGTSDPVEL